MEIREKHISADGVSEHVVEKTQHIASPVEVADYQAAKSNQAIWYIIGFIEALLALRFLFNLLGARQVGFANFLDILTNLFVAPFRGIFPAPALGGSYFDTAALVAMIIVALIGWAIASLINISNPRTR